MRLAVCLDNMLEPRGVQSLLKLPVGVPSGRLQSAGSMRAVSGGPLTECSITTTSRGTE